MNEAINTIVAKLVADDNVFYLDVGKELLGKEGSLSKEIMPDLLHLSERGYTIWVESIEPTLVKLMGE